MGMSNGGNEGLFRMAENAAPKEDRIMPGDRIYLKSDKTVDLTSAIALMKQRRLHPEEIISGGLDDNSNKVNKRLNKSSITEETKKDVPETHPENDISDTTYTQNTEESKTSSTGKTKMNRTAKVPLGEVLSVIGSVKNQISALTKDINFIKISLTKPAENTEENQDRLERFRSGEHRVTFIVNGMEFTVKCLSMTRDPVSHCIVLAFKDDGESFFVPQIRSELRIKYDGSEIAGKLFYFGMCFSLKPLGLKFLGFLSDETESTASNELNDTVQTEYSGNSVNNN